MLDDRFADTCYSTATNHHQWHPCYKPGRVACKKGIPYLKKKEHNKKGNFVTPVHGKPYKRNNSKG